MYDVCVCLSGLLGDAPGANVDSAALMNPNLQIALLSVLLATQLQSVSNPLLP